MILAPLRYEVLIGAALRPRLEALAALRMAVFRHWPYLYEGTLEYERHYLETYVQCPQSIAVLVWDGAQAIGATTALPLAAATAEMQQPFIEAGQSLDDTLYFGESVVQPAYRGRGIGVAFFQHREAHARQLGLRRAVFCAVERSADHPLKPAHHQGNERFWQQRGYQPTTLQCHYTWLDVGAPTPTEKVLRYWQRTLPP